MVKPCVATIAAGHPETAAAGAAILQAGGNAVDAAISAALASFVSEVGLTGPFGGGFALVGGNQSSPVAVDFFANVPGRGLPTIDLDRIEFKGVEVSFGPTRQSFHVGRGSVAVSSVLDGLSRLHQRFGSLSMDTLVARAVELATQGTKLTQETVSTMQILAPIFRFSEDTAGHFLLNDAVPPAGEHLTNLDLARFLASTETSNHLRRLGQSFSPPSGLITDDDLDAYGVIERLPLHVHVAGYDVYLNPPPSSGGLLIAFGLKLLARCPHTLWTDPENAARHLAAAMAVSLTARDRDLGEAIVNDAHRFLDDEYVDSWQPLLESCATDGLQAAQHEASSPLGSTTHISVLDGQGLACSITTSNGEGCGILVPETGAMGNNFLGEADLNPNGFHANPVGQRLTSMMCPTLLAKNGEVVLALGSGGSNRIRTALLQTLARYIFMSRSIDDAVKDPRFHYEHETLFFERRCGDRVQRDSVIRTLDELSPQKVPFDEANMFFGGVHAAAKGGAGTGDPRRQGVVRHVDATAKD